MSEIEQTELEPETTQAPVDAADIPAAAFSAVEEVVAVAAPESQVVSPTFGESADAPASEAEEFAEAAVESAEMVSEGGSNEAVEASNESVTEEAGEAAEAVEEDPYRVFRAELRAQSGKWFVVHSYAGY